MHLNRDVPSKVYAPGPVAPRRHPILLKIAPLLLCATSPLREKPPPRGACCYDLAWASLPPVLPLIPAVLGCLQKALSPVAS